MTHAPAIAIVGMSCRFPGAESLPAFWDLLLAGHDAIEPTPPSRTALSGAPGSGWGGYLRDLDRFDACFFGISPAEAAAMDPQQRLWLEVAWQGAEDAGIVPAALAGTRTGVYTGQSTMDYAILTADRPRAQLGAYTGPGLSGAVTANRLSYLWDLRGPSLAVDTACSSSLVAVHLAVSALRLGECDLAFAGGVNVLLSPVAQAGAAALGALAADGRCRAFDAAAGGYVRSEGAGCLVLKRVDDAIRDGDEIHAVIAGSALNQDGLTNGLTAPSGKAQVGVITEALRNGGLAAAQVGYAEAHGTATRLGDPIEARSLRTAYGPRADPLLIGSVKANIGHLEAAAGVAGIIKVALMLSHRTVPPSPHFVTANPLIDFAGWDLEVPVTTRLWPPADVPAAGVSSFGFGGTNGHLILTAAPARTTVPAGAAAPEAVLLPISARSPAALAALTGAYAATVAATDDWAGVVELAAGAAALRTHFPHRRAVVATSPAGLLDQLNAGPPAAAAVPGRRLAYLYSGHGGQWPAMGRDLLGADEAFTTEIHLCDEAFAPHLGFSVAAALSDAADLDDISVAQPLIVAVQLGLTAALAAHGVRPDAVAGHSVGEIPAAVVAGRLTRAEAGRILRARSDAVAPTVGAGRMIAVDLGPDRLGGILGGGAADVVVAAVNSPRASVLSGPAAAVARAAAMLVAAGHDVRDIKVAYPSHSPVMAGPAEQLAAILRGLGAGPPTRVSFYSTVTGQDAAALPLDAAHWAGHLAQPVLFAPAMTAMLRDGVTHLAEIGPHPVLISAARECIADAAARATAIETLRRDTPLRHGVLDLVAGFYEAGWTPEFTGCRPALARRLPAYPFDRTPVPTLGISATTAAIDGSPAAPDDLLARLSRCHTAAERAAVLRTEMLRLLGEVLPAGAPVAERSRIPFHQLGMDSLMAVELRNRLERALRLSMSVTTLWAHPTVEQLAAALAQRVAADGSAAADLHDLLDAVDVELEVTGGDR